MNLDGRAEHPQVEQPGRARQSFLRLFNRELVNRTARFGAAVVLARSLTTSDYGIVNIGIAASGVLVMATTLGLHDLGAREVAVRRAAAGRLVAQIISARLIALAAVGVLGLVVVGLAAPEALPVATLVVAMSLMPTLSPDWVLRGEERMRAFGTAYALGGLAVFAGSVAVGLTLESAVAGLAVFVLGELTTMLWCWFQLRGEVQIGFRLDGLRSLVRRSWPLGVSALALYAYSLNADTLILGALRSAEEAGLYSAAYRIFITLTIPATFASFALLPIAARRFEAGQVESALGGLRSWVPYLFAYGALILGAAEIAGRDLLGAIFGAEFEQMGETFVVLSIGLTWSSIGGPIGYALVGRERNRSWMAGALWGVIVNLVLTFALVPSLGALGAGIATAVAFVTSSVIWLGRQGMLDRAMAPVGAATVAATAGAVIGLVHDPWLPAIGILTVSTGLLVTARTLLRRRLADGTAS